MMPTKVDVLYDQTSAANTALDTGLLDTGAYDFIGYEIRASAGITASTLTLSFGLSASGPSISWASPALTAAATQFSGGWGPGCTTIQNGALAIARPVPPAIGISVSAAGVGITMRIIVYGRRNHRGPDVSINPD